MPIPINISASRGAAVLGLSSYNTPVNVFLSIMESREPGFCVSNGYAVPEFQDNAAIRFGHAFEDAIIHLSEGAHGHKIRKREKFYTHPERDYLTCHIDGMYTDGTLHEAKTTSEFYYREHFGEPGTDRVPVEYQIQVQHQMMCTGAIECVLSVLVFPRRPEEWEAAGILSENISRTMWANALADMGYFHQYKISANPVLHSLMLMHYTEFWENNILTGIPPEPKSYDDIKMLVTEPIGTVIATEEVERLMAEYRDIKREISPTGPLGKRADMIRAAVLNYMRKSPGVTDDDSVDKWILRSRTGQKIASWTGGVFR